MIFPYNFCTKNYNKLKDYRHLLKLSHLAISSKNMGCFKEEEGQQ